MKRLSSAHRTCNLILGVGDGKVCGHCKINRKMVLDEIFHDIVQVNEFRGVEYSAAVADFFTYDNLRPAEDWHPKIQDVVYWGKLN